MAISSIGSLTGGLGHAIAAAPKSANPFSKVLASASGTSPAASTPGATAQQQYNQSLSDLQRTLAGLFSTAGIDASQPIAIEQGPEGNLSVSNSHPDIDKIEQVLAAHPELVPKFKTLAANLLAVKQAAGVQNLPDPSTSNFILTLTGSQATTNFS